MKLDQAKTKKYSANKKAQFLKPVFYKFGQQSEFLNNKETELQFLTAGYLICGITQYTREVQLF